MRTRTPLIAAGLSLTALPLLLAAPAAAHVTADKSEVPAGGFTDLTFTVPHGCEASPTTAIAIQIPDTIYNVTPAIVTGWTPNVETETLAEPVEGSHGEQITERDAVVTYTAQPGSELPDGFRQSFTVGFQAPDTPGETLLFPVVQTCVVGETAWIEVTVDGEEEPEHPAPAVEVVASEGGGHGDEDEAEAEAEAEAANTDDGAEVDESNALEAVALVVGAGGLIVGGLALARGRRS